jgi:hypothetical protein
MENDGKVTIIASNTMNHFDSGGILNGGVFR